MDLIAKIFKWCVCATLFIVGCGFLFATDQSGSVKPVFVAILAFGILYWLSRSFFGLPRKLLGINCLVLLAAIGCAFYFYHGFEFLASWGIYDLFFEWTLWSYVIGIPVMGLSFAKWGDD